MRKKNKPTKAQIEVLKKLNEENLIILNNTYFYKSSEFYKPSVVSIDKINYITFCALRNADLIDKIQHEKQDKWNYFYQIS